MSQILSNNQNPKDKFGNYPLIDKYTFSQFKDSYSVYKIIDYKL